MSVVYSTDGLDLLQEAGDYNTIFILADFSGESFHRLHRAGARIVGPPVIIKCAFNDEVRVFFNSFSQILAFHYKILDHRNLNMQPTIYEHKTYFFPIEKFLRDVYN